MIVTMKYKKVRIIFTKSNNIDISPDIIFEKVKFKNKVFPGDTIIFKCTLISPIRRGICHMQGYAYANGKLCAEAELIAQITKVK